MAGEAVLVVGGAGYIGSHTAKALKQQGFTPIVVDDLSMGHTWAAKFGPFVQANMGDAEAIRAAVREHNATAAILFAASAYVGESVANPRKYYRNNVSNMEVFLGALVDEGVKAVIFSSSCATYGVPQSVPLVENHPQLPISPYGETKLVGERMLHWFDGAYGLKHVALRYFNASGADPDGEIGEVHDPETHLIPLVMGAALGTQPPITVFGTDYPTPDGTAVRDYIHVADLADAHIRALRHLQEGGDSLQLNVGTGNGYSVKEIIAAVERETEREVPRTYGPRRAGDPPELYADPSAVKAALGWEPRHSGLAQIVRTAWRWELRRRELGL